MRAPAFWSRPDSPIARLLAPLGWLYAEATARRLALGAPWRAPVPVVCVGNLTAGGAGKTPVVRDLARRFAAAGKRPAILSRGYGGRLPGPLRVDPARHGAADVGDEPLLLASGAPCWISADRAAGAKAIAATEAGIIIMDDGLQNPDLAQDLRLIVADGGFGFGNRRPISAGPLRESIAAGIGRGHALIIIGEDRHGLATEFAGRLPIFIADLAPANPAELTGRRVAAFAGIGRPAKFRATLEAAGATVAAFTPFADHHRFSENGLARLAAEAQGLQAELVTTEKDWMRLSPPWRERIAPVPVAIRWRDETRLAELLARMTH